MVEQIRVCAVHGETIYVQRAPNKFACRKCAVVAVQKRRIVLKLKAIEYKGGKCTSCGYNRCVGAMVFHHPDPTQKDFGISCKGYTRSWEKVKAELDKCVLLCANCHAEEHEKMVQ